MLKIHYGKIWRGFVQKVYSYGNITGLIFWCASFWIALPNGKIHTPYFIVIICWLNATSHGELAEGRVNWGFQVVALRFDRFSFVYFPIKNRLNWFANVKMRVIDAVFSFYISQKKLEVVLCTRIVFVFSLVTCITIFGMRCPKVSYIYCLNECFMLLQRNIRFNICFVISVT